MENCEPAQYIAKFSHKTVLVRLGIKWLMAEAKVICACILGVYFQVGFFSLIKSSEVLVQIFSVLYIRFWMSAALICRVLPLARIMSSAWIFSMTNPLPRFIPPAASECFKTPGHHDGFWEATVVCTSSATRAGWFPPEAFFSTLAFHSPLVFH